MLWRVPESSGVIKFIYQLHQKWKFNYCNLLWYNKYQWKCNYIFFISHLL